MDNKEVVKRMRQVADILESGEELQWRAGKSNSEWANYEDDYGHREMLIDIDDDLLEFRAKPGPRDFWVNVHIDGSFGEIHPSIITAISEALRFDVDLLHLREVTDE